MKEIAYQVEISFSEDQCGEKSRQQDSYDNHKPNIFRQVVPRAQVFSPDLELIGIDMTGGAGSYKVPSKRQSAYQTGLCYISRKLCFSS
ncbi:MAG: hypothetical protein AAB547_01130 [Patescibacteria group bacterium]